MKRLADPELLIKLTLKRCFPCAALSLVLSHMLKVHFIKNKIVGQMSGPWI